MIDKYELGEIVNLDSRGFAEAEQHRTQLPPTPTLQELAKVTTMHKYSTKGFPCTTLVVGQSFELYTKYIIMFVRALRNLSICSQHVFTSLKDKQDKLWSNIASHNFIITDLEAVNKLLGQLEGGGAVPGPRAYISVLGRYNVGKSTLLNALLSFE